VRSYARHLGLDATEYVERFKRDISGRAEEKMHEPAPIHQDEGRRLPQGWRIITGAVIILLGWGAWHLLAPGTSSNQPVPPAPNLNPPKPAAPKPMPPVQTAVPSPAADAAPQTSPQTSSQANPQATPQINAAPGAPETTAIPPPAAGAKSPATSLPPPAPANPTDQAAGPAVPGSGAGQVYGSQNMDARVVLRARGDVRVTVKNADGQMILNRDLKSGDSYQVPNTPGVSMATNNAGAVEVDLDGIALGRAGPTQQILGHVSLDPQSLEDRFNDH
jgi:cytoskeleton protein RodZ